MKSKILTLFLLSLMASTVFATTKSGDIVLSKPNLKGGKSLMETFSQRKSVREFSNKEISHADLSNLLWAANGVSRADGKRTAPSAMNKQEIAVYAFTKDGAYRYDFKNHSLELVKQGDYRTLVSAAQKGLAHAPLFLVYIADESKLSTFGDKRLSIASMDAGIVCQNVNLFCSAVGIGTVPRITMNADAILKLLNLSDNNVPLMNNAIGYHK